ncbi:vWA domain-containing protein [Brevibacillus sp. NRS-1366]|uniref:vWA domain-containing protein n=1 Tax=Brevibacillus sp. NRS-1366 TaxID=3233899 RepID=UPI003D1F170F
MPKQGLTEIIAIIDKSGSMDSIKSDAIGGFNTFLESQKNTEGDANLTIVLFDSNYNQLTSGERIKLVQPLNDKTYVPSGMTALLDAIGRAIDEVSGRIANTPEDERPEKVISVILTDGDENASREYKRTQIMDKIKSKQEEGWQFLFLAANQDAIKEANSIGINGNFAMNFAATGKGITNTYSAVTDAVSMYRSTGAISANWKDESK